MILLRTFLISTLIGLTNLTLSAQNCLDYGEFDDPTCFSICGPNGWDVDGTAYIAEGDTYNGLPCGYNVPESPTGGTYQMLWDAPWMQQGYIANTITGLTPGIEYQFGFWAATPSWTCNGFLEAGEVQLIVEVDGLVEIVPTTEDWGLYEYCVTATSSTMDISFLASHTGLLGPIMLDDAFCSDLTIQCCELALDADDELEVCPGDDLEIQLSYQDAVGNVDIIWESNPPSGLNFVDLADPENPIFNYDSNANLTQESQYILTAIVEDELCELQIEIVVNVLAQPEINFGFDGNIYCSNEGEFIFPTTSANGIEGTWDVSSVFLQDHPGELINVLFTVTDPNIDCPITTEHYLEVQEEQFVSFDFPLIYCRAQNDIIFFPDNSLEDIEGTWDPSLLEIPLLTDGFYDISFTPDDPFCINGLEIEIEIYSGDLIEFDLPDLICASEDLYVFPTENLNNVPGTWEFPSMDLSNASGVLSNTFTPNTIECYANYEYTFEVQDDLEVSFNIPSSICQTDPPLTLDINSMEGYQGQWSEATLDPNTFMGDSFTSTWTPTAGQSDCLTNTSITIAIEPAMIPEFDIPAEFCSTEAAYNLPSTSNQGITGSWNTPVIDPASGQTTIQSTFVPTAGQCAQSYTVEVQILAADTPSFDLPLQLCQTEDPVLLPSISDNSISGTWNVPSIDPSTATTNTIALTFTPSSSCVEIFEWVVEIQQNVTPMFSFQEIFCWDDMDFNLPATSLNGIEGTWDIPIIETQNNTGQTINSTFTPIGECGEVISVEFAILDEFDVQLEATNPSDCNLEDGVIQITGQLDNLEFSIDGGLSWSEQTSYPQLGSGTFDVWVSSTLMDGCYTNYMTSLEVLGAPTILSVNSTNIATCLGGDGTIEIAVDSPNDLEYSIDGGINWQSTSNFSNLDAGTYEIQVRPSSSPECLSVSSAVIAAFLETEIISITPTDISDCQETDGSIVIEAIGEDLEYSIDGGQTWSSEFTYENLAAGNYNVQIRSTLDLDCIKIQDITITAPGTPNILSSIGLPSSQCFPNSGSIIVDAESSGGNILYSIDGNDWQEENEFVDLPTGNYTIYVQDDNNPNCIAQAQVSIAEIDDELATALITEIDPTECNLSDGSISITINETNVEFSNDAGQSWQDNPNFDNLSAGTYVIIIRKIDAPNCTSEFLINLIDPDCPCNDLVVDLQIQNNDCLSQLNPSVQVVSVEGMEDNNISIVWNSGATGEQVEVQEEGWQIATIIYDDVCQWQDSIYLEFVEVINFEIETTNSDCPDASNGSIDIFDITGGSGNYQISLNEGIDQVDDYSALTAGIYTVLVSDDQGCTTTETIEIIADEEVVLGVDEILNFELGDTLYLNPQISAAEIDSFQWNPNQGIINPGELVAQVTPGSDIAYEFQIFYGSCFATQSFLLNMEGQTEIYIPNIIDLDSETNHVLYPQGSNNIELLSFYVYDRWGELIFSNEELNINNLADGWDGRFNGQKVNPGVYVYILEFQIGGQADFISGSITVLH